jgi:hypothetical protein
MVGIGPSGAIDRVAVAPLSGDQADGGYGKCRDFVIPIHAFWVSGLGFAWVWPHAGEAMGHNMNHFVWW